MLLNDLITWDLALKCYRVPNIFDYISRIKAFEKYKEDQHAEKIC